MAVAERHAENIKEVFVTRGWDKASFFGGKMQKRGLNNTELDVVAAAVIKSDSIHTSKIEDIVCDPLLFDKIKTRIKEEPSRRSVALVVLSFIRRNAAAVSGVLLISIAAISFGLFKGTPETAKVSQPLTTGESKAKQPAVTRFHEPDVVVSPRTVPPEDSIESIRPQRASVTRTQPTRTTSRRPQVRMNRGGDFYALSYAGDPNETERGGRIIRVDMSRSALFAMGVDIPLENEAEVVKAELLVGNDGVTRAIRVLE